MADEKLVLYGESRFHSPYVFSCYVALKEKGLPFELTTFSLDAGEHRTGEYGSRSITGRVPSLRHGDFWLAESSAIDEYLEDVFPAPRFARLYPEAQRDRARARQVQAWLRSDLMPIRDERPTSTVFGRAPVTPLTEAGRTAVQRLVAATELLLPQGATFLFGDFGIVDVDLAMMLQRLVSNGDPLPRRLAAYAEGIWKRPPVQDWISKSPDRR